MALKRDRRGRRRQIGQERGLRPLYPELPPSWLEEAFEPYEVGHRLRERFRAPVEFRKADARGAFPDSAFRLLLCRNVVFTYFDEELQRETLDRLLTKLEPGGAFIVAPHEKLPADAPLEPWFPKLGIYRRPE